MAQNFKSQNDATGTNMWPEAKAGNRPESQVFDTGKGVRGYLILSSPDVG